MRVVFMGSPDFAVPPLRALIEEHEVALVVTQPDKPAGRGKHLLPPAVKEVALTEGLPIFQPTSVRKPDAIETLRQTGAELAVVVAYGKILPRAVLEAFPRGCINVHASLLPKYRGAAPIQRAIMCGETETGVTIMQLDEGMDTGPVLAKSSLVIEPDDTAGTLFDRLAPLGAELLLEAIDGLARGALTPEPQDPAQATHAPMLDKDDGAVDWTRSAAEVSCHIRGVDPWPGAFTVLGQTRLKLFLPRVVESDAPAEAGQPGQAGQVLGVDERGLLVACGQGVLAIAAVQASGGRRMEARAFASGHKIPPGAILRPAKELRGRPAAT
jgi:methionyl-tRNA formyltransferase